MKKTIKKVLEELNKESPRLDYIRGILEVLVDEEEKTIVTPATQVVSSFSNVPIMAPMDIPPLPTAYIKHIQNLSEQGAQ